MDHPKICFYYEVDRDRIETNLALMDSLCSAWDMQYIAIDSSYSLRDGPFVFRSLEEARAALSDHVWYFFYPTESMDIDTQFEQLEEMEHLDTDLVVYAIGSNLDGFQATPHELNLRPQDKIVTLGRHGSNLWSAVCVLAVAYDRWCKRWQPQE